MRKKKWEKERKKVKKIKKKKISKKKKKKHGRFTGERKRCFPLCVISGNGDYYPLEPD